MLGLVKSLDATHLVFFTSPIHVYYRPYISQLWFIIPIMDIKLHHVMAGKVNDGACVLKLKISMRNVIAKNNTVDIDNNNHI